MCRNIKTNNLLWTVAVAAGLAVAGTAVADPALPGPVQGQALRRQRAAVFGPIRTELRSIQALLQLADRDYQGHRAAAVRQISLALRALPPVPGQGKSATPAGGGGEPQALSDAQLNGAIQQLGVVLNQLTALPGAGPAKATGHVRNAIKELQVALTIK